VKPLIEQIKEVYKISIPQIVTLMTLMMTNLYNIAVIGNLGNASDVAGAGMANMLMNIIANSNLQGMAIALGTLASQAFGKKEYEMCGVYLNRGRVICVFLFIITVIPLQFAENFFLFLGLDKEGAEYA
jgi:Na+-driven multidrug efflux pump